MTDEFAIRKVAQELIGLYEALEERKHSPEKPPEVRTMQNTGGKPSMPGNWLWMARGIENEQKLREVALNAFGDLGIKLKDDDGVIRNLLGKIAFNAQAISELPWAEDFHQELDDQARQMGKWLNPPEPAEVARRPERYVDIDTIVRNLNARGHQVTSRQVREVAVYQKFDIGKFGNGKNGYKLTEFLHHYEKPRPRPMTS